MRLGLGLRRSLICFAPLAFVPQRQKLAKNLPSLLVFHTISTDFTPTPYVPLTSSTLKFGSIPNGLEVEPQDFIKDFPNRLKTLYAQ